MTNLAEILRLIANLIRLGTIAEIDHAQALVRVATGELLTDWLPWITARAGTTKDWNPPTQGEQVLLLSPSGDLSQAIILLSLNSSANPAPQQSADVWFIQFPDGTSATYNHAQHQLTLDIKGDTALLVTGNQHISIDKDSVITVKGNATFTVEGDMSASVTGTANLSAQGDLTLQSSANINITASGNTNIQGATINLN